MFDRVYRRLGLFLLLPICLLLWGCHAVHAGITKRELRVDTRVSQTIFIEPLPESQKIVYVDANFVGNNASAFSISISRIIIFTLDNLSFTCFSCCVNFTNVSLWSFNSAVNAPRFSLTCVFDRVCFLVKNLYPQLEHFTNNLVISTPMLYV